MTDSKISDLTAVATPALTDLLPVVQTPGAGPKKATVTQLKTLIAGVATIAPSSDTFISDNSWGDGSTNYDTSTTLQMADGWDQTVDWCRVILMTFDLSALSGRTCASAVLKLYRVNDGQTGAQASFWTGVRRILRAYNATQVTQSVYSTGNSWTSAGARGVGADIDGQIYGMTYRIGGSVNSYDQWWALDITPLVQQVLDEAGTTLRIGIAPVGTTTAQNPVSFASLENATTANRPFMTVTYI